MSPKKHSPFIMIDDEKSRKNAHVKLIFYWQGNKAECFYLRFVTKEAEHTSQSFVQIC